MSYVVPVAAVGTVALAAGGWLWWKRHKTSPTAPDAPGASPASPGRSPASPASPVGPVAPVGSNDLPAKLQGPYQQLLAQGQDPDALEAVAQKLDGYGFTAQAQALRVREAALRAAAPVLPAVVPPPQAPFVPPAPSEPSAATHARVTTRDPAPAGDLVVRSGPGASYGQVGGAEKDGIVQVLAWNVADAGGTLWAKIAWPGGPRWGPASGYAHQAYLVPTDGAIPSGGASVSGKTLTERWDSVGGKRMSGTAQRMLAKTAATGSTSALVRAPNGLRVRSQPVLTAATRTVAPARSRVTVLRTAPGWSFVDANGVQGWAQSQWLEEAS